MDDEIDDYKYQTNSSATDTTVSVRTDSDTHLGVERKSGGWLERETERILQFAGMNTQRERRVVFEESTSEHYRVDILAQYDALTLFVECKDYSQIKVDEKILFTLIGQVHDYRRDHPNEMVVGILVTSAKNAGQNLGIHNKLLREGCHLWDGTTIQKMQDKMIEMDSKSEFAEHLFEKLGYFKHEDKTGVETLPPGQHKFFCRMQFFSIPDLKYIGNKFSRKSIIEDLKKTLRGTEISASIFSYKNIDSPEGQRIGMFVDFEKIISDTELNKLRKKKSSLFRKPKESPAELMEKTFESTCTWAITKTYGIETSDSTGMYKIQCVAVRSQ